MSKESTKILNKLKSLAIVTFGGSAIFTGLCIYHCNERFYERCLMPAIRFIPPETSHQLAVWACKYKLFRAPTKSDDPILVSKFFDFTLNNPLGIAAGFDKQGEAIDGLLQIGFGFVEVGSVTPQPQTGNPSPRVFRLNSDQAVINRYGFNSDGHTAVYERLKALRESKNLDGLVGVNLGQNKHSSNPQIDYIEGVKKFAPVADYLVINISSPNTPGLRDLQNKSNLEGLLSSVLQTRNNLPVNNKIPLLLKLAPDLTKQDVLDIVAVINKDHCRIDGFIVSNTTVSRENLTENQLSSEIGGLSGAPLRSKATQLIAQLYDLTNGKIPIIGVGGIFTGQDAYEKLEAGASYLQIYTAFIYHGPPVAAKIKKELTSLLKANGYSSIAEAVGRNYKKYLNK